MKGWKTNLLFGWYLFRGELLNLRGVKHQRKKWKHFSILISGNSSLKVFLLLFLTKTKNELSQQLEVTSNLVSYHKFWLFWLHQFIYIYTYTYIHIHIYIYVYRWFDLFLHRVAFLDHQKELMPWHFSESFELMSGGRVGESHQFKQ